MTDAQEQGLPLQDFIKQEKKILDDFAADWEERHACDPEDWPMELSPQAWDDEYRLFHDLDADG